MSQKEKRPRKIKMIDIPMLKKKAPLLSEITQVLLFFRSERIKASWKKTWMRFSPKKKPQILL
jgi:hypothetical protein